MTSPSPAESVTCLVELQEVVNSILKSEVFEADVSNGTTTLVEVEDVSSNNEAPT